MRVANDLAAEELGWRPGHPDYLAGIRAMAAAVDATAAADADAVRRAS